MNRDFFKYLVKAKRHLIFFVITVYLLIAGIALINRNYETIGKQIIVSLSFFAYCLAGLVPILLLGFVHSRKACDSYFALPIKRSVLLVNILGFVFVLSFVPFAICVLLTALMGKIGIIGFSIGFLHLLALLAVVAFGILTTIFFISGLYLMTNSVIDGIIIIGGYLLIPVFIYLASCEFVSTMTVGIEINLFQPIMRISLPYEVAAILEAVIKGKQFFFDALPVYLINTIIHLLVGIFLVNRHFVDRQTERAENISNGPLCYPFLLVFYSIVMTFLVSISYKNAFYGGDYLLMCILYLLIFAFYTVFTFIYRRKIVISLKSIITFVLAIVLTLSFSMVATRTRGFGLVYTYKTEMPMKYDYSCYSNKEDDYHSDIFDLLDEAGIECDYIELYFEYGANKEDNMTKYLEDLRLKAIDNFYENKGYYSYEASGYLRIYSNLGSPTDEVYSGYNQAPMITTKEELDFIENYTDISISFYATREYKLYDNNADTNTAADVEETGRENDLVFSANTDEWTSITYSQLKEIISK